MFGGHEELSWGRASLSPEHARQVMPEHRGAPDSCQALDMEAGCARPSDCHLQNPKRPTYVYPCLNKSTNIKGSQPEGGREMEGSCFGLDSMWAKEYGQDGDEQPGSQTALLSWKSSAGRSSLSSSVPSVEELAGEPGRIEAKKEIIKRLGTQQMRNSVKWFHLVPY